MSLETYATRTLPWKPTESVFDYSCETLPPKGTWCFVQPALAMDEGNALIRHLIEIARMRAAERRIQADVYKFWSQNGGAA